MTDQSPVYSHPLAPAPQYGPDPNPTPAQESTPATTPVNEAEPRLRLHLPSASGDTAIAETRPIEATPTEAAKLSAEIVDRVLKSSHRLRSALAAHFAEFDLSDVRFSVLRFLHDSEPAGCTQSELAQRLDQSESSISTLVKRMRDSGLLYRLRSTIDKRKWALKLTESGRGHFQSAQNCHANRMGELLGGFEEDELKQLLGLLDKLVGELASENCEEKLETTTSNAA